MTVIVVTVDYDCLSLVMLIIDHGPELYLIGDQ